MSDDIIFAVPDLPPSVAPLAVAASAASQDGVLRTTQQQMPLGLPPLPPSRSPATTTTVGTAFPPAQQQPPPSSVPPPTATEIDFFADYGSSTVDGASAASPFQAGRGGAGGNFFSTTAADLPFDTDVWSTTTTGGRPAANGTTVPAADAASSFTVDFGEDFFSSAWAASPRGNVSDNAAGAVNPHTPAAAAASITAATTAAAVPIGSLVSVMPVTTVSTAPADLDFFDGIDAVGFRPRQPQHLPSQQLPCPIADAPSSSAHGPNHPHQQPQKLSGLSLVPATPSGAAGGATDTTTTTTNTSGTTTNTSTTTSTTDNNNTSFQFGDCAVDCASTVGTRGAADAAQGHGSATTTTTTNTVASSSCDVPLHQLMISSPRTATGAVFDVPTVGACATVPSHGVQAPSGAAPVYSSTAAPHTTESSFPASSSPAHAVSRRPGVAPVALPPLQRPAAPTAAADAATSSVDSGALAAAGLPFSVPQPTSATTARADSGAAPMQPQHHQPLQQPQHQPQVEGRCPTRNNTLSGGTSSSSSGDQRQAATTKMVAALEQLLADVDRDEAAAQRLIADAAKREVDAKASGTSERLQRAVVEAREQTAAIDASVERLSVMALFVAQRLTGHEALRVAVAAPEGTSVPVLLAMADAEMTDLIGSMTV